MKSHEEIEQGDHVSWRWGRHRAHGTVKSVFVRRTTRKIAGSEIVKNGSHDNPALYIVQDDGGRALKLLSEVEREPGTSKG